MKDFLSSLAETTKRLNFGIIVHNRTDSTTFSIKKGEVSGSELPESISGHIFDVNCHCAYFSHGEKVVVIYFVRFILKKQHLVVIIQDTKQRLRVNKFISALINSLYGNRADTNLTEEFLENFDIERRGYEQRIQKLTEDALFDKALWQREKDELSAVVAELKSDIENYKLSKLWDKASEEEIASLREGAAKLKGIELKYENLVRDMWVIKNDLEDARRENLALSGELSAEKACKEAGSGEEKESAIRAGLEALKNENTALRREIREYSEIIAKKDALLEELNRRQNMGDVKENSNETQPINTDSESETDRLRRELEKQFLRCSELEKLNEKVTGDFSRRGDILEECRKELSETQKEYLQIKSDYKRLDALKEDSDNALEQERFDSETERAGYERELSRLNAHISDLQERNTAIIDEIGAVGALRDELLKILNGVVLPIFTVDENDTILYANRASEAFRGNSDIAGKICYETIHSAASRCEWCLAEQVRQNEESAQVSLTSVFDGIPRTLELTFFPIVDTEGTVVKIAEIILDKTEAAELNNNLSKTKERLKELKAARSEDLNRLEELTTAFQEVSEEHKRILERNNKMIKVIERLVTEDKARELINARLDLTELRNKLFRANDMIKNYKYQLDEQLIKYSNLNRRTFMQIERLFNTVKGKTSLKGEESVAVLSFLSREFERVRKQFIDEEKGLQSKKDEEEPTFESVEEQMLKEKFSAKLDSFGNNKSIGDK